MFKARFSIPAAIILLLSGYLSTAGGFTTELRSRGFSLIPAPQKVHLAGGEVRVDRLWSLTCEAGGDHIAARRLKAGARELHGLELSGSGTGKIVLRLAPGTVKETNDPALNEQAYKLEISPGNIVITGNAGAGLFYGVQSLLQLLRSDGTGGWRLPEGTVTDWPALQLRFVHWDSKHHQDRPETLKRFIDWAAFFKVNAIGFEIEDKYEYPSHPIIGAPGAFTKAEMQELTAYALERFIQLVPQIQSPAHMAYVLKHEQFAHLRADGNNYQACLCSEEAISLIQDMYRDMIEATPGVKYFHVSTDEVYFAGICDKCRKKRPYNDGNRSLSWVDYVNRMHPWLAERGRRMLCWVEYPLLTEHLLLLPRGLINGVIFPGRSKQWIRNLEERDIRSLVYSSQQGGELLFPNYFSSGFLYRGKPVQGRLADPARNVARMLTLMKTKPLGTFAAAWDDSGLHNETFWLGWATVTQYGWSPDRPAVEQNVADFMDVFYGPGSQDMVELYRSLMERARFYEACWDRVPAAHLKPTYGNWAAPGQDTTRIDLALEPPALPFSYDYTLVAEDNFSRRYAEILKKVPEEKFKVEQAIFALQGKLGSVKRNRYNLEVLLSIAYFEKHFLEMLTALERTEKILQEASQALREEEEQEVLGLLVRAHNTVGNILEERSLMWKNLKRVWEKSRYPKGRSVGGRRFVHILDDLKDHKADRRPGLEYMLVPLENIGLEKWNERLAGYVRSFAAGRGLEVRELDD